MRLLRHLRGSPVAQYLAVGLLGLVAALGAGQAMARHAARDEALGDARATTQVLATSVAEPAVPRGLVAGEASALDRFDRIVLKRLLVDGVQRIKLWREDGTVVYSDEARIIGERFALGEEELEILREGGAEAEVSDLGKPENRFEPRGRGLVEVYTQIRSPEGEPLLFETYYAADGIDRRQAEVLAPFHEVLLVSLGLLVALGTAMLALMNRRVRRAAAERERLLRNAATASDAERRRIARDLHDGVVQDLAASSFTVSALARDAPPEQRPTLDGVATTLRTSMRSLRSLLVEIHPPELTVATLPAALQDLLAPAEASGVAASLHVGDLGEADPRSVTLVWRVAQEGVRNALRHARAATVHVRVRREDDLLVLEVVDDGRGFDPASTRAATSYGLRGLQSLAVDHAGRLAVTAAPGAGTTIHLEVGA